MLDEDVIVGGKYLMGRKIGSGSFGSIMIGTDIETAKYVAIKFVSIFVQFYFFLGKTINKLASTVTIWSESS